MKVAMYYKNDDVRLEEMPKPKISSGEILIKMKAGGICGSDVMEWYRIKKAPIVLGHEVSGEVSEVAEDVKNFKVGDRVFVSHHVPCNVCSYCLNGKETVCETLQTTNFFPGGFSEYIRVPSINVDRGVFILPEKMSFDQATFIEPLACVVRGQREVGVKSGDDVLIFGAGISGVLHLLLALASGASKVFMVDVSEYRLVKAKSLGANLTIDAKEDIRERFKKENNGKLADVVIVCTSATSAFKQAFNSVDRGGSILCFAPPNPGVELVAPINDFWRKGIKIIHSYGNSPKDADKAIKLISEGAVLVSEMITHRFNLQDTGLGFRLVAKARDSLKIIIHP